MSKKKNTTAHNEPILFLVHVGVYCADHHHVMVDRLETVHSSDMPSDNELERIYCSFFEELIKHDLISDGMTLDGFIEVAPVIEDIPVKTSVSMLKNDHDKEEKKYS